MALPNFIVIGTQKAGTTALAHYLKQHPQIYITPIKEPGFFDFEGNPPNFCGPGDQPLYAHVPTDIETYRELFKAVKDEIAIGEATTWYLYSPRAAERIHHYIPDAKLIVILRNPVDRAYSGFMHAIRDKREVITDFALALREEEKRIEKNWEYLWRYKDMGFYSIQLQRYFERFDRSQIKVYLYEDLNSHPINILRDIFQFLQVDETFIPDMSSRHNVTGIPKNRGWYEFWSKPHLIKEPFKLLLPFKFRRWLSLTLRNRNLVKPQISSAIRSELIEVYREDVLKLQDLLQRDLSKWLEPEN